MLHVHEEAHAEDGEDEHDEEEEQADVEQGWDGHGQGEEQGADAARALHQAEHAADLGNADHAEEGGRDKVLLDQVAQHDAWKRVDTVQTSDMERTKLNPVGQCKNLITYHFKAVLEFR